MLVLYPSVIIILLGTFFASGQTAYADAESDYHYLTISFSSVCCGPDVTAIQHINVYLAKFQKQHTMTLKQKEIYWGEEGESDYCIDTAGIPEKLVNELMDGLEQARNNSDLTDIYMADACRPTD